MMEAPYSLGKLIDWKQLLIMHMATQTNIASLLVREINWLETIDKYMNQLDENFSLLVREINWLETSFPITSEISQC